MDSKNQNNQNDFKIKEDGSDKIDSLKLEDLLRENLLLTREVYRSAKKTQRYILFAQIFTIVKIIIIVGPIILAVIYLPQIIREAIATYSELLGGGTGTTIIEGSGIVNKLFDSN